MKKCISWNVNGLRAAMNKGFADFFQREDADFFCVQETKLQAGQIDFAPDGYYCYWNYAERKGYSGTAIFAKEEPLAVSYGIGIPEHDTEGRVITLEYPNYYFITVYTPNAQQELTRLAYRQQWEDDFRAYLLALQAKKPVIFCGDLNVAHREIDLKNPKTFRYFYPDKTGAYSWWSYRFHAREKNAGWRIDYFLVSAALREKLMDAAILADVTGSDHCPVLLLVDC